MSFNERALELLEKTESSLVSLMSDALKAHAYGDLAAIAGIAEATAAIRSGATNISARQPTAPAAALSPDAPAPSWMRRA